MQRKINYIVVHCTATPVTTTIESIERYWKEQKNWKQPGYHYIIKRNGVIINLLPEDQVSNGVKNFNLHSIHISYIGGVDENNSPVDNRTAEQKAALLKKLAELKQRYPAAKIQGHRDFSGVTKSCPSFDVRSWLKEVRPELIN
jgi:N-acetylmuramoyl-L-alanine amidase